MQAGLNLAAASERDGSMLWLTHGRTVPPFYFKFHTMKHSMRSNQILSISGLTCDTHDCKDENTSGCSLSHGK
jgi:hypothetical protein